MGAGLVLEETAAPYSFLRRLVDADILPEELVDLADHLASDEFIVTQPCLGLEAVEGGLVLEEVYLCVLACRHIEASSVEVYKAAPVSTLACLFNIGLLL